MFGDDFMGNPKNSGYYDMLKFAIYCPYISALGVKNNKTKGKQCLGTAVKPLEYQVEYRTLEQSLNITM